MQRPTRRGNDPKSARHEARALAASDRALVASSAETAPYRFSKTLELGRCRSGIRQNGPVPIRAGILCTTQASVPQTFGSMMIAETLKEAATGTVEYLT